MVGMRLPSKPDALETSENKPESPVNPAVTVNRDPSYPDRARIDSDVRAFLRPVSSPWIVFDRDSRVDDFAKSALRVGAVFSSSPSLLEPSPMTPSSPPPVIDIEAPAKKLALREEVVITDEASAPAPALDPIREGVVLSSPRSSVAPETTNMFPTPTSPAPEVVEPSNLVVATDVIANESSSLMPSSLDASHDDAPDAFMLPSATKLSGRTMAIAGAAFGVLALVGLSTIALSRSSVKNASAEAKVQSMQVVQPQQRDEIPPVALAAPTQPTMELDSAPLAAPAPAPKAASEAPVVDPVTKMPLDPKKRFGKLTIKADAKHKNVWFDGKRMLGSGQRTFMVFCGMHTIAVADKTDTKDVEIPCNGEYTVTK